jgi:hypothetical protein
MKHTVRGAITMKKGNSKGLLPIHTGPIDTVDSHCYKSLQFRDGS